MYFINNSYLYKQQTLCKLVLNRKKIAGILVSRQNLYSSSLYFTFNRNFPLQPQSNQFQVNMLLFCKGMCSPTKIMLPRKRLIPHRNTLLSVFTSYLPCHLPNTVNELQEDGRSVSICVIIISMSHSLEVRAHWFQPGVAAVPSQHCKAQELLNMFQEWTRQASLP